MAMKKVIRTEVNDFLNIVSTKNTENITIKDEDGYFLEEFYYTDIYDEAKYKKFIKACEKTIRTSSYYSQYIGELNALGITNCAILGNVSKEGKVQVEMHHFPFSLYDIVQIHITKNLELEQKMTTFSIAYDVMQDHFDNIIPLVPLSKTVHQLVHEGEVFISINQVYGDVKAFIEKYEKFMSDEQIIKYNKIIEYSEQRNTLYEGNTILDINRIGSENVNDVDIEF